MINAALLASAVFVADTYYDDEWAMSRQTADHSHGPRPHALHVLLIASLVYFALSLLLALVTAPSLLALLLDPLVSIDAALLVAGGISGGRFRTDATAMIYPFVLVRAYVCCARIVSSRMVLASRHVARQSVELYLLLVGLTAATAGFIQVFESKYDGREMAYHDALFFTVVTASTVGYGDIVPSSVGGRMLIMVLIVVFIVVVPWEIGRLIELISSSPPSLDPLVAAPAVRAVLLGAPSHDAMADFLDEFYHADHGTSLATQLVVLSDLRLSLPLRHLLSDPFYRKRVVFRTLRGPRDDAWARLATPATTTVFLHPSSSAPLASPADLDALTALRAMASRRHSATVRIIATAADAASVPLLHAAGVDLALPAAHLAWSLYGLSVLVPGVFTLFRNLTRSYARASASALPSWRAAYLDGAANELYAVDLTPHFVGTSFVAAAAAIYARFGAVLIGVHTDNAAALDAGVGLVLRPQHRGVVIAHSAATAHAVSLLAASAPPVWTDDQPLSPHSSSDSSLASSELRSLTINAHPSPAPDAVVTPPSSPRVAIYTDGGASLGPVLAPLIGRTTVELRVPTPKCIDAAAAVAARVGAAGDVVVVVAPSSDLLCPHSSEDEENARSLLQPDVVLVLAGDGRAGAQEVAEEAAYTVDAPGILAMLAARSAYRAQTRVVVELVEPCNIAFLPPYSPSPHAHRSPAFASGDVVCGRMLDSLLCYAHFFPAIAGVAKTFTDCASAFDAIALPPHAVGASWGSVWRQLLDGAAAVALALWRERAPGRGAPSERFVYTNPDEGTVMLASDWILIRRLRPATAGTG
ncbi:uncharacterized protein AMSG_10695 [Thecamonas trahens ATCC 50062]|uniref:Potassium channel domain-containing protein n=1 Tax=Thecamonas trahens ATCC 50062 TaxID=461836 RepID=A0A0L0DSB1_THETB|nr:hypothetical protein AMSG_10695 [Thecamonas trahens ATCC 50062]KNC55097.1 hypothetical protein AMSG_10695 [Thecamonas trahens ATCC 50062]|eukprot:XP_013753281.1 hypothetical protein AMSG_10695 [Thecamonas trahens ATCC 50062]